MVDVADVEIYVDKARTIIELAHCKARQNILGHRQF
jgi:hypothetical protein